MANDIWYTIKNNRLRQGYTEGFEIKNDNTLYFDKKSLNHYAFLKPIDGVDIGSKWGRLTSELLSSEEIVCYIYIMATDELNIVTEAGKSVQLDEFLYDSSIPSYKKTGLLTRLGAKRFVNSGDVLLYDLEGRFLFVAVEIVGNGEASIGNIRVGVRGDNFIGAFPAVYQERNSFLHRYLSIFSSIYNDISEENDRLYEILDLDKCSVELLEMYGSWFGIDLKGGFLPEDVLRNIVKEAYNLNRMKGTKLVLERLLQIMLGDDAVLYENRLQDGGVFNVTVLVNRKLTEELRHQIMFILDQFRPIRTKIRLLQMEREAVMDGNSYLDLNAAIPSKKNLVLDEEAMYDGTITLV